MIRELKARLTELKVTCVMVTHSQKEAFEFCDTLLAMTRSAGPFQIGSPQEVYEHPQVRQIAEITGEGSFFTSARSGTTFQNIWGEFELRRSEPELQFFVRPENVVEGEGPEAVVQSVTYRGHEVFVELEASASKEKILMSRSPLAPRLTRGQRLRLGLSKEGAWLK